MTGSRGWCPVCGRDVTIRLDGTFYLHNRGDGAWGKCPAAGQPALQYKRKILVGQYEQIKTRASRGEPLATIARDHGVTYERIRQIVKDVRRRRGDPATEGRGDQ